ncbi:MAG TPA: alkaline phosphatase family protein [Actinomycetota bacterium]|nr:alkaline phosphatase family protein [Actinomycetota bacterium]
MIVILMENEEYASIIGDLSAPYINSLAAGGALATQYYAVDHPSLPNYLALTGGSTFGVTTDCTPGPSCTGGTSVVEEMAAAGIGWRAYMQDMPGPCAQADSGEYVVHHDPFVYYNGVVAGSCGNVVPASQLPGDIAAGALPAFTWLTPNLCNDMHDCSVATGDAYLAGIVPQLLGTLGPDGALFLVWDEGTSNTQGGGQVTMVAAGSGVKKGYRSSLPYDHYSLLRTIEDAWGLPLLGNSAAATPMADLFS